MVALNLEYVIIHDDDQVQMLIVKKNFLHEVQIKQEELKDNQLQMNDNNLYHHLKLKINSISYRIFEKIYLDNNEHQVDVLN